MPSPDDFRASSSARAAAYFFDLIAASTVFLFFVGLSEAVGARIAESLLYPACLFLYSTASLWRTRGTTLGKFLRNITVVDKAGGPIEPIQAVLRSLLFAPPYACLTGGPTQVDVTAHGLVATAPLLGSLYLLTEVILLEYTVQRRTVADRLCRTLVVKLPPLQPHRAPAAPMFSVNDAEFGNPPKRPPS